LFDHQCPKRFVPALHRVLGLEEEVFSKQRRLPIFDIN
jgi:hypothetical protein